MMTMGQDLENFPKSVQKRIFGFIQNIAKILFRIICSGLTKRALYF